MTAGKYLVLEGGDGAGKTDQAKLLVQWLGQRNRPARHLREPGSTASGEALRGLLLSRDTGYLSPLTEALMFSAARAELLREEVSPALLAGEIVLVERCYLSTLVYQGVAGDQSLDLLRRVTSAVHGNLWPDRVFLLDVDEATRLTRVKRAAKNDRIESRDPEFHAIVRKGYLDLAAGDSRVEVIDARQSREEVQAVLRQRIEVLLQEGDAMSSVSSS